MQVTTPEGRWLVPPDRAVWVPARLEHSIDVLADIEMRNAVFRSGMAGARGAQREPRCGIRGCGCRDCYTRRSSRCSMAAMTLTATGLLVKLAVLELHRAEDSATFIPLPHEPRCRRAADIVLDDPTGSHEIETLAREVGTSARTLSRLFSIGDATELQELVPARAHRRGDRKNSRSTPTSRSSSSPPISATPACRRFPRLSQVNGKTPTEFAETK